ARGDPRVLAPTSARDGRGRSLRERRAGPRRHHARGSGTHAGRDGRHRRLTVSGSVTLESGNATKAPPKGAPSFLPGWPSRAICLVRGHHLRQRCPADPREVSLAVAAVGQAARKLCHGPGTSPLQPREEIGGRLVPGGRLPRFEMREGPRRVEPEHVANVVGEALYEPDGGGVVVGRAHVGVRQLVYD